MFHRSIARLLHRTPQEAKQHLVSCHTNKSKIIINDQIYISCRRHFKKNAQASVGKKTAMKDKTDSEYKRPQSLIAQKLFKSQQHTPLQPEQRVNTTIDSLNDMRSMLEDISKEAISTGVGEDIGVSSSQTENSGQVESSSFLGHNTDEDVVENIVFRRDLQSQPKPSPLLGTEDRSVPVSNVPCVGCGALLHCQHRTMPGFLPSERFKLLSKLELKSSICQRCHYIQHCDAFVEVTSDPEDYEQIISKIRPTKSLVVMVVDVMDIPGSIIPNLATYIGHKHPLVIVGNKVDLIAPDSTEYLTSMKEAIKQSCTEAGLRNIRRVMLISAKTGFGIERLINVLFSYYNMKVDVFIVGTANAGKSSLFNTLLASDYCKHRARDLIQRATISAWPGTTLNLLKFPIMNMTPRSLALRQQRLNQEKALFKEAQKQERQREKKKEEAWELKEEVKTTDMRTTKQVDRDNSESPWGQEVFAYKGGRGGIITSSSDLSHKTFDSSHYEHSYWVYDTPGVINSDQTFNLLEPHESPFLQPVDVMTPRCVFLKPGTAVFISALARLDYVQGDDEAMMIVIHSSPSIPVRAVSIEEADQFYLQHAGTQDLGIPIGDKERLNSLPSLVGKEITLEGINDTMSVADIQLSSIGWVSLAPKAGCKVKVTAFTPSRKGIQLRQPSVLPKYLQFKGKRISGTPFFWPKRFGLPVAGKKLPVDEEDK